MEIHVSFEIDDHRLFGVFHRPDGAQRPYPAVLFCHGLGGSHIEANRLFVRLARQLARRNIGSLRFDYFGSGNSEGESDEMSILTNLSDSEAALRFLKAQQGVDVSRVGVLGFSLGGAVAAMLAGAAKSLKSLVLWAPVADIPKAFKHISGAPFIPRTLNEYDHRGLLLGQRFFEDLHLADPLKEIQGYRGPLLVIHGDADEVVLTEHGQMFVEAMRGHATEASMDVVPGAGHTFAGKDWSERLLESSLRWFERTL